jgi:hypothetical protein
MIERLHDMSQKVIFLLLANNSTINELIIMPGMLFDVSVFPL